MQGKARKQRDDEGRVSNGMMTGDKHKDAGDSSGLLLL